MGSVGRAPACPCRCPARPGRTRCARRPASAPPAPPGPALPRRARCSQPAGGEPQASGRSPPAEGWGLTALQVARLRQAQQARVRPPRGQGRGPARAPALPGLSLPPLQVHRRAQQVPPPRPVPEGRPRAQQGPLQPWLALPLLQQAWGPPKPPRCPGPPEAPPRAWRQAVARRSHRCCRQQQRWALQAVRQPEERAPRAQAWSKAQPGPPLPAGQRSRTRLSAGWPRTYTHL